MNFEYNKDDNRRKEIIWGTTDHGYRKGGTEDFDEIDLEHLNQLIEERFADPREAQNNGPTIRELQEFLMLHNDFVLDGYIVSPERDDYRVTFTAIKGNAETQSDLDSFVSAFRMADDFTVEFGSKYCYAWWD